MTKHWLPFGKSSIPLDNETILKSFPKQYVMMTKILQPAITPRVYPQNPHEFTYLLITIGFFDACAGNKGRTRCVRHCDLQGLKFRLGPLQAWASAIRVFLTHLRFAFFFLATLSFLPFLRPDLFDRMVKCQKKVKYKGSRIALNMSRGRTHAPARTHISQKQLHDTYIER